LTINVSSCSISKISSSLKPAEPNEPKLGRKENIQKLTDDGRQTPSDDKSPNLCSMPMIIDKILEESVN
jgi:hypothetical protein